MYNRKLKQAPWAPPAYVFGPAWTLNNFFLLLALKRILEDQTLDARKKLLVKQGLIWCIFFSFGYVYFRKKSPLLAAAWTISDAVLALSSLLDALKTDKRFASNYLPLLGWTGYAGTVAVYQALKNPDPVTDTPALV